MRAVSVVVAVLAIVAAPSPAAADAASKFLAPVPNPSLTAGTLVIHAQTSTADPLTGYRIAVAVDGITQYRTTGHDGNATFEHLQPGASIVASATDLDGVRLISQTFSVPADHGISLVVELSYANHLPPEPERTRNGTVLHHRIEKRILVGLRHGPTEAAPKGTPVILVAYAADGAITSTTHAIDGQGVTTFTDLDETGSTAYYVLAQLPRKGRIDRLVSQAVVLEPGSGMRVDMAGLARDSTAPAIDETPDDPDHPVSVPAGKVRIALSGTADKTTSVTLHEAATGAEVARATITAPADHADVAISPRADQVVYAETTTAGARFRSHPIQLTSTTGSAATIYILPAIGARYHFAIEPADPILQVTAMITLANNSWAPITVSELPLPRGFTNVKYDNTMRPTATGVVVERPLPPGGKSFYVSLELPAAARTVRWHLDLPFGSTSSELDVAYTPGTQIQVPESLAPPHREQHGNGDFLVLSGVTVPSGQALDLVFTIPAVSPIERACNPLRPDAGTHGVGKPAHALVLAQLDGKKLDLASLRGRVTIVTFMASWDQLSGDERPQIAKLAAAVPGSANLLVFSDADTAQVRPVIDPRAGYRVVLDPPVGDTNIGPTTLAWGTKFLPESYVIDRKGIVRYYFANMRDWSSKQAIACIEMLAR